MDLREISLGGVVWIGFDWLRTGTGGGLLWVRWWSFGFLRHGVSYIYIVTNSQVLLHDGTLLHSQFNTQLLITVHNSSRIRTQVQLLSVLEYNSQITLRKSQPASTRPTCLPSSTQLVFT
jgi:hypothetical protein